MGYRALEGLEGVIHVTRGWRGMEEINTVWFDPSAITIEEMEEALKKARTYRSTFKD